MEITELKKHPTCHGIEEMKGLIKDAYDTKQFGGRNVSLWLWSLPGVGKSSAIQEVAEEIGCEFAYIPGSDMNEGEIGGMPVKVEDEEGHPILRKLMIEGFLPQRPFKYDKEKKKNVWDDKADVPYNKPGILFIDEFGNCDYRVRKELLTYIDGTEKKGAYTFPPKWIIVAASNTEETGGISDNEIQANVLARFTHVNVIPLAKEWLIYASKKKNNVTGEVGISPLVMAFLRENPDCLISSGETYETEDTAATPRRWDEISGLLMNYERAGMLDEKKHRIEIFAEGMFGKEIATKFLNFIDLRDKMINANDIITINVTEKYSKTEEEKKKKDFIEKLSGTSTKKDVLFISFETAISKFLHEYGTDGTAYIKKADDKETGKKSFNPEKRKIIGAVNIIENLQTAFGEKQKDYAIGYMEHLFSDDEIKKILIEEDTFVTYLSKEAYKLFKDIAIIQKMGKGEM